MAGDNLYESVVITGGGGMLAHALADVLRGRGVTPTVLTRGQLDVADEGALAAAFAAHQPTLLLNCAAHTKVDLCETEAARAEAINGYAVGGMARLSRENGTVLAHVSTDFVFDGSLRRPYRSEDVVNPLSVYGRSKLLGERELQRESPDRWLIVRTAWVYGRHGQNFPRTMVTAAQAAKPLRVVSDQQGSPTYAPDLAEGILSLLESGANGIWHVTNSGETTWLEFAQAALAVFGIEHPVQGVTSEQWNQIRPGAAARPGYSVLDLAAYERQTGRKMRPWREALGDYRKAVRENGF